MARKTEIKAALAYGPQNGRPSPRGRRAAIKSNIRAPRTAGGKGRRQFIPMAPVRDEGRKYLRK